MTIRLLGGSLLLGTALLSGCSLLDSYHFVKAISEMRNCDMKPGQRFSNYEVVKAADAIVLAKVTRVGRVPPKQVAGTALLDYRAEFEIESVLKGAIEPSRKLAFFGFEDQTRRAREDDFAKPTRLGADPFSPPYPCGVPYQYRAGAHYLLFLVRMRGNGPWTFPPIPVSRLNEEVDGEESPWVQAVTQYIRIASLQNEQDEAQALRELQARARRADDPLHYPPALAADVDRYFARKESTGSL